MGQTYKRTYNSSNRQAQALLTKNRILSASSDLFAEQGFEGVTIDFIAQKANVSAPTVYALFGSKKGILRALMDEALPSQQYQSLVEESLTSNNARKVLLMGAKIARVMYDAERTQMSIFRGASMIATELKELELEREERRYHRLETAIAIIDRLKSLKPGISPGKARDIMWAYTGRDIYRLLVIERGWSSDDFEQWLGETLIENLLQPKFKET